MSENCLNCRERHPACHDSCSTYKEFKKKRDEINVKRRRYMDGRGYDGCLAPKSGKYKGYEQTRFRF
jgi:hypothetical protein